MCGGPCECRASALCVCRRLRRTLCLLDYVKRIITVFGVRRRRASERDAFTSADTNTMRQIHRRIRRQSVQVKISSRNTLRQSLGQTETLQLGVITRLIRYRGITRTLLRGYELLTQLRHHRQKTFNYCSTKYITQNNHVCVISNTTV